MDLLLAITCHFPYTELQQLREWYFIIMEYVDRVAQLFGVNDLNRRIDLNTNGSEAEGGVFTED